MDECNCVFCNSKCPECGSTNIEYEYRVSFTCENTEQDEITLERGEGGIELKCRGCGEWVEEPRYSVNNRLDRLSVALNNALDLPSIITFSHKKGGKIEADAIRFKPANNTE
jgi:hypothetical protein